MDDKGLTGKRFFIHLCCSSSGSGSGSLIGFIFRDRVSEKQSVALEHNYKN